MPIRKATRKDCNGCDDDFYNRNRMGANESSGKPECWMLKEAKMIKRLAIPVSLPPPYKGIKTISRPNCYTQRGMCYVNPDAITKEGYWKR